MRRMVGRQIPCYFFFFQLLQLTVNYLFKKVQMLPVLKGSIEKSDICGMSAFVVFEFECKSIFEWYS